MNHLYDLINYVLPPWCGRHSQACGLENQMTHISELLNISWELSPEEGPSYQGFTEVGAKGTLTPAGSTENWWVSHNKCVYEGTGSLILPHKPKHTHTRAHSHTHTHTRTTSQETPTALWKWGLRPKGQWGRGKYDSGTPRLPKHQIRPNCINN